MKNVISVLGLGLALLASPLAAQTGAETKAAPQTADDATSAAVIVRVNDIGITKGEFEIVQDSMLSYRLMQMGMSPEMLGEEQMAGMRAQSTQPILDQMISKTLVENEAKAYEDKVAEEEIDVEYKRYDNMMAKEGDSLSNMLLQTGMTQDELRGKMRQQLAMFKLVEAKKGSLDPTEEDLEKAYQEDSVRVRASHILLPLEGSQDEAQLPEDSLKGEALAESLLKRINDGEEFEKLASEYSICPSSRNGGDLGLFGRGKMIGEFEDAAFGMKPGEVSGIVKTQFGYHIIKVTGIEDVTGDPEKAAALKAEKLEELRSIKFDELMPGLVHELREAANIEYLDDAFKPATEAAPTAE